MKASDFCWKIFLVFIVSLSLVRLSMPYLCVAKKTRKQNIGEQMFDFNLPVRLSCSKNDAKINADRQHSAVTNFHVATLSFNEIIS